MNRLLILICALMVSLPVWGETVLVFTKNSLNPEIPGVVELQAALEDGVMETLFDAGHIVFNAGVVVSNEKLDIPSERLSMRLAKSGGAYFLLEIDFSLNAPVSEEEALTPREASYRLYSVLDGGLLTQGDLVPEDVNDRPDTPVNDICIVMGESIASGTLGKLRL